MFEKLKALKADLHEYFTCIEEEFLKASDIVNQSMVYIKDIGEFIKFIIAERNIDPLSTIVKVVVDLVKVTMNIFNSSDKTSNQPDFEDAGVKCCFVVAVAERYQDTMEILGGYLILLIFKILSILLRFI